MTFDPSKMAVKRQPDVPEEFNSLTHRILSCAFEVHTHLGPGLREKLYEQAMIHELRLNGLVAEQQVPFRVRYKELELGWQVVDTVVEQTVVLELKAVEKVTEEDLAQLVGYLHFTALPIGLLLNFNKAHLRDGIHRKINWPPRKRSSSVQIQSQRLSVPSVLPQ